VKQVYQERMVGAGGGQQRPPSPEEFMNLLRGGRGGRRGGGGGNNRGGAAQEAPKIAIGVDTRTNSLVVSAPQPTFEEIQQLVLSLDQVTEGTSETMRVVALKQSNNKALHDALTSLMGESLKTSRTPAANGTSNVANTGGPAPDQR
jgi:type II secretory pathway component GspD/PulD (secretin)